MRFAVWGQLLALVVALSFGRASIAAPCAAHDGPGHSSSPQPVEAAGHHHGDATVAGEDGHGAPHDVGCTCLDDCHGAAATAWVASDPVGMPLAYAAAARRSPPRMPVSVARANQPYVLPFATAPPAIDS